MSGGSVVERAARLGHAVEVRIHGSGRSPVSGRSFRIWRARCSCGWHSSNGNRREATVDGNEHARDVLAHRPRVRGGRS